LKTLRLSYYKDYPLNPKNRGYRGSDKKDCGAYLGLVTLTEISYNPYDMPSPVVIYWESSNTKDIVSVKIRFPNNKTIVYKVPTFKVLQHSVSKLEGMALRCNKNNYITERDTAMLLRKLSFIYNELYGKHEEFMEADMTIKKIGAL